MRRSLLYKAKTTIKILVYPNILRIVRKLGKSVRKLRNSVRKLGKTVRKLGKSVRKLGK